MSGPWSVEADDATNGVPFIPIEGESGALGVCEVYGSGEDCEIEEADRVRARLIAAAPDHALTCWAMCVGAGRWEAWGDGRGEFCINGLRHATELDQFGCPVVTDGIRAAIIKAQGSP